MTITTQHNTIHRHPPQSSSSPMGRAGLCLLALALWTGLVAAPLSAKSHDQAGTCDPNATADVEPIAPALDELLTTMEQRGEAMSTFQAEMVLEEKQQLVEALTRRTGQLLYKVTDNNVRFRIHFDTFQQVDLDYPDDTPEAVKMDLDFAFDGLWFAKRDARTRTLQLWELSDTPADREAFRLGRGPFPLPFALKKEDVLSNFHVTLNPDVDDHDDANDDDARHQATGSASDDGKNAEQAKQGSRLNHLLLKPKEDSAFAEEYVSLALWVPTDTAIPRKLRLEKTDYETTTVTWSEIVIDEPIDEGQLAVPDAEDGWQIEKNYLDRTPAPSPQ